MREFYLEVAAVHIAYIKFIFESYEEVGIIRTVDRKKAIIVLLAMNDFVAVARDLGVSRKRNTASRNCPARQRPRRLVYGRARGGAIQPINWI